MSRKCTNGCALLAKLAGARLCTALAGAPRCGEAPKSAYIHSFTETGRQAGRHRQAGRQTDTQAAKQTGRQSDRQTGRQTDNQTD